MDNLFENGKVEVQHHVNDELPKPGRKNHKYGAEIIEQVEYAVKLLRAGHTEGVRDRLAERFGRMTEWLEVCQAAHDIWKVALDYYE